MMVKSLQLLKELVLTARRIAVLINPPTEVTNGLVPIQAPPAAVQLGVQLDVIEVREIDELAAAIAKAEQRGADALDAVGDPMFHSPPNRLPVLAAEAKLPTLYLPRALVEAGGLMSYSPSLDAIEKRVPIWSTNSARREPAAYRHRNLIERLVCRSQELAAGRHAI